MRSTVWFFLWEDVKMWLVTASYLPFNMERNPVVFPMQNLEPSFVSTEKTVISQRSEEFKPQSPQEIVGTGSLSVQPNSLARSKVVLNQPKAPNLSDDSSEEDLSLSTRPFKVKPLNKPVVPRLKWTENKSPNRLRKENYAIAEILNEVEDLDIASQKLQRRVEKNRSLKLVEEQAKRSLKKDKLGVRIVTGEKAMILRSPKRTSVKPSRKSHCVSSYIEHNVPQMFRNLSLPSMPGGWLPSFSIDAETRDVLEEVADKVSNVNINHTISSEPALLNAVTGLTDAIKDSHHTMSFDLGQGAVKSFGGLTDFAMFVLVAVVILLLKPENQRERMYAMALVTAVLATRFDLAALVKGSGLFAFLGKPDTNVPQGMNDPMGSASIEDLTTILSSMINMYLLKSVGTELLDPKEFLRVTTQISRSTPTVVGTMRGIGLLMNYVTMCLDRLMGRDDAIVKTGYGFIDAFWKEYKEIVELWESRQLFNRQESVDRVKSHIALGESIYMKLPGNGTYGSMRMAMINAVAELTKIRQELMSSNFKYAGVRQEPLALLLIGKPGVFKSQAMQHLAHAVNALLLDDEEFERYEKDPNSFVYNRQAENVYWDGYTMDKTVVFFDDILQARDVQGEPDNEAMNVIRSVNIFESKLHMASIKDKGNTSFRSKFVLANTNMESFNLESINQIGAFMRRWDVVVRVVPSVKFAKEQGCDSIHDRSFDENKFPLFTEENCGGNTRLIGTTRTHPDMCEFHLMKYVAGSKFEDIGVVLTFDELVLRAVGGFRRKEDQYTGYGVGLNDTLAHFREMRGNVPQSGTPEEDEFTTIDGQIPSVIAGDIGSTPFQPKMVKSTYHVHTPKTLELQRCCQYNLGLLLYFLRHVKVVGGYEPELHLDKFYTLFELALEEVFHDEVDLCDAPITCLTIGKVSDIFYNLVNPMYPIEGLELGLGETTWNEISGGAYIEECSESSTGYRNMYTHEPVTQEELDNVNVLVVPQGGIRRSLSFPEGFKDLENEYTRSVLIAVERDLRTEKFFMSDRFKGLVLHLWRTTWMGNFALAEAMKDQVPPEHYVCLMYDTLVKIESMEPGTFGWIERVDPQTYLEDVVLPFEIPEEYISDNPGLPFLLSLVEKKKKFYQYAPVLDIDKSAWEQLEGIIGALGGVYWNHIPDCVNSFGKNRIPPTGYTNKMMMNLIADTIVNRWFVCHLDLQKDSYLEMVKEDGFSEEELSALLDCLELNKPQIGVEEMENIPLGTALCVQESGEFEDEFKLTEKRMRHLYNLKVMNHQKFIVLYFSFVVLMKKAYIEKGAELLPNLAFDCCQAILDNEDIGHFYGVNLKIKVVVEDAMALYFKREKTMFRPDEEVMKSLDDLEIIFKENEDTLIGRLGKFYRDCILYLSVSGSEIANDSLKSLVKSEPLRRTLGVTTFLAAGFYIGFKTVKLLATSLFSMMPQSNVRSEKIRRAHRKIVRRPTARPEGALNVNRGLASNREMIYNNSLYDIWFPKDDEPGILYHGGMCLAVRGQTLLMPWHFYSTMASYLEEGAINGDDLIELKRPGRKQVVWSMTVDEFVGGAVLWDEGDKQDLILIRMPKHFPMARDIVMHFATAAQHNYYIKVPAVLCVPSALEKDGIVTREVYNVEARAERNASMGDDKHETYTVDQLYRYNAATDYGDCGGLLFVNDAQKSGSIIGMHIAGSPSKNSGLGAKITREFIEEYLRIANEGYKELDQLDLGLLPTERVVSNMTTLGINPPQLRVPGGQTVSSYVPSPIKDKVFVSPNGLARLRPFEKDGVLIDPMDNALSGYSGKFTHVNESDVRDAAESYFDYIESVSNGVVDRRVYTFEEAVLGDGPGSEFKSIPRSTSAGFPYNTMGSPTSKQRFFGMDDEYDLTSPSCVELKNKVHFVVEKAKEGVRCMHIFTDALKDEKRTKEKVSIGKTRMFAACPTELLIATRMYFGAFSKWVIKNRIDNGIAIGVNEYSSEWDLIARRLNSFGRGSNKGAGDFSGLDKRELPLFFLSINDEVNKWYRGSEEDNKVRSILILDLIFSRHVNNGYFFEWVMSMPSGHFLTALFNSITVQLLFRVSFKILTGLSMWKFHELVFLITLGDDNAYAVDEEFKRDLNEVKIGEAMLLLGQDYTSEDKLSALKSEMRRLEDISFLKRKWFMHKDVKPARYMGPLDLNSLLDILNWRKKGGNVWGDTETNISTVLHELTLHGKTVFDQWSVKILDVVDNTLGLSRPPNVTYRALLAEVTERDGFSYFESKMGTEYGTSRRLLADENPGGETLTHATEVDAKNVSGVPQSGRAPQNTQTASFELGNRTILNCIQSGAAQQNDSSDVDGLMTETRVDEGSSAVQIGMTNATNDGGVRQATPSFTPISSALLSSANTGASREIVDFLKRPKMVSSGTLSTANVANVPTWSINIPADLFPTGDIWYDKVKGFLGFRGTLHITIQLNASRFQQGRYMLVWLPSMGGVNAEWKHRVHTSTLVETTQLPHVEFDVNCDTEATLIIPQVTVNGWSVAAPANYSYNNGKVGLFPYSPLVAPSGSTTVGYTIYAHYEDVELCLPNIPQSGRVGKRIKRRPGSTPAESEQASAGIGPIQALASKVSLAARHVGAVPLLSSVALPVAWAADVASNVASAFGWSKPRDLSVIGIGNRTMLHKMTNVDTADYATKLALTDRNELEDLPSLGGTDEDEMSINYIATIPSYFRSFAWTQASAPGSIMTTIEVTPRMFFQNTTQASTVITHTTPLAFVARMFALWRCDIKFIFKLVKTEFHSGRLLVVFDPSDRVDPAVTVNLANSIYLHRQIVDVREGSEFSITIPFMALQQYRPTAGPERSIGNIHVLVLNSLVAPATVSSTVPVIIEVCGAGDCEFAQPASVNGSATAQWIPQSGRTSTCRIVESTIGNATSTTSTISSRACVGERILSLRQLLKRYNTLRKVSPGTNVLPSTSRFISYYPFMIHMNQIDAVPSFKASEVFSDLFDEIAPCFGMFRGSMRYKFVLEADDNNVWTASVSPLAADQTVSTFFTSGVTNSWSVLPDNAPNRMIAYGKGDFSGALEVEVPYYSLLPAAAVCDMVSVNSSVNPVLGINTGTTVPRTAAWLERKPRIAAGDNILPEVWRAIGEDASLIFFMTTVPITGYDPTQF